MKYFLLKTLLILNFVFISKSIYKYNLPKRFANKISLFIQNNEDEEFIHKQQLINFIRPILKSSVVYILLWPYQHKNQRKHTMRK